MRSACRSRALCLDLGKTLPRGLQNGLQAAHRAQLANRDIAVLWIDLNAVAAPPGLFSRDQRCAGSDKRIEHNALAVRTVADGIGDHRHGFYRRMKVQIGAVAAKAVDA